MNTLRAKLAALAPTEMALDIVDAGEENLPQSKGAAGGKAALPPGVTSKMLYKDVIWIAWPALLEMALTQLASMVDLMMVGRLGPWALSAVGLTTQPKFLLMTLFMSLNVGTTAMVARYKGAGEQDKANRIMRQSFVLTFALSLLSSLLGFVFAEPMVRLMGAADAESLLGGTQYLQIQMIGFVFMALTSTATAALRGVGDSRTAMIYNLLSNVVNVILNYIMIYGVVLDGRTWFPRLEVAGASWATVIGQLVAFLLAIRALMSGRGYLHLRIRDDYRLDWKSVSSVVQIGIPAMLEQFVMRAGMIIYNVMVARLGTVPYATHQVCMNINAMSFMIGQGFAVSATSLVGQSLGKRRSDMAQYYATRTQRVGMAVSVVLALMFFFWGAFVVSLYSDDLSVIREGGVIMRLVALTLPLQASQFILSGALRGAGDTRATAIISFLTILLLRPTVAALAIYVLDMGLLGAWIALLADQIVRSALVLFRYTSGKWKGVAVQM